MTRAVALAVAAGAIALVLAQLVFPATGLYHTWQYALALALALFVTLSYAAGARRGADGATGKRLAFALAGAAVVELSGLASGLLGPDTALVIGTPGTVVPLPSLGAAAFFAPADGATLARGSAEIRLRRRNAPDITVGGAGRRLSGESLLYPSPRPAAYVEARDERGTHLTITQPSGSAFLSPVLLFRDRQRIGPADVPLDTFATPARKRVFRALFFTPADLARFGHPVTAGGPALIVSASDEAGRPLGIAMVATGAPADLAGVRLQAVTGSYPALAVAAAPEPWALVAGLALFVGGLAAAGLAARAENSPAASPARAQV